MIRRVVPLIVVGVAGAAAARRRSERLRRAQLGPGPAPVPPIPQAPQPAVVAAEAAEQAEVEPPEPEPEPAEPDLDEQPTVEQTALERAPLLEQEGEPGPEPEAEPDPARAEPTSVTDIVDDLLAPGGKQEAIQDATVVDGSAEEQEGPPDDGALADAVRAALAEPGLSPGDLDIDVQQATVVLTGQVERAEAIVELERRAAEVPGISSVRSLLHLPGTPPPIADECR